MENFVLQIIQRIILIVQRLYRKFIALKDVQMCIGLSFSKNQFVVDCKLSE